LDDRGDGLWNLQKRCEIKKLVLILLKWFSKNARDLPWRRTHDPYAIWISEIMLQQTQVKTVIPYWERWMRELPTIESFAQARPEKVLKLWEGLGYYTRARNAQRAAQLVIDEHGGAFPTNFDAVLELPGIGRYTAGAICSIAFNQPTPILDGNVVRVLTRIFGIEGDPRDKSINAKLWELAQELISAHPPGETNCSHLNQALMELGALICTPRNAQCPDCPAQSLCFAHKANRVNDLPALSARAKPTQRRFIAFVAQKKDKYLVRQRPADVVNAHLWEFPNIEVTPEDKTFELTAKPFIIADSKPICRIQHSITRYRITLEAYRAELLGEQTAGIKEKQPRMAQIARMENEQPPIREIRGKKIPLPGTWKTVTELTHLPFTSAHRKICNHLFS
jgi:A/G-specific adenine glycosylase